MKEVSHTTNDKLKVLRLLNELYRAEENWCLTLLQEKSHLSSSYAGILTGLYLVIFFPSLGN